MSQQYKTKIAHVLDNGDKLEFETWVTAEGHDEAFAKARAGLRQVVTQLAAGGEIGIDKSKIELGAHNH